MMKSRMKRFFRELFTNWLSDFTVYRNRICFLNVIDQILKEKEQVRSVLSLDSLYEVSNLAVSRDLALAYTMYYSPLKGRQ